MPLTHRSLRRSLPLLVVIVVGTLPIRSLSPASAAPPAAEAAGESASAAETRKIQELGKLLPKEGLRGTIHGAEPAQGAFVFTWWDPKSFFDNINFSLVPANDAVAKTLAGLERHQRLRIRGRLIETGSPQPHILVEAVKPGEKWKSGVVPAEAAPERPDLTSQLAGKKKIHAMVHAVDPEGGMLVLEYGGGILPVVIPEDTGLRSEVKSLYRGDKVDLRFHLQETPGRPSHLVAESSTHDGKPSITVTERIETHHGKRETVEGRLVLFPKSPSINRAIWGVESRRSDGLHWYFTIFDFDDPKDQGRIDAKLQAAWDRSPGGIIDARNKYIQRDVRVRVTGTVNNPAQNQANPTLKTDAEHVRVVGVD